jgi:hypothetical protein
MFSVNKQGIAISVRVARYFLVQHTKTGKNIPNMEPWVKFTEWPQNIPNGRKINQMAVK